MKGTYIVTIGLLLLDMAVMLLARWFDRRYYVPFLNTVMKQKKEPEYNPYLIRLGLVAAGGGLLLWSLAAGIWIWIFHK